MRNWPSKLKVRVTNTAFRDNFFYKKSSKMVESNSNNAKL